jgi:HPt (histidine-containing phosphotransfer) domain-containing protein
MPHSKNLNSNISEEVSLHKLIDLVGDSTEKLNQLTQIFLNQLTENCSLIEQCLKQNNYEQLSKIAHQMRPGFILYHLLESATACHKIEDAYLNGNFQSIPILAEQILFNRSRIEIQIKFALEKASQNQTLQ